MSSEMVQSLNLLFFFLYYNVKVEIALNGIYILVDVCFQSKWM